MPVWRSACLKGCLSGGMPVWGDACLEGCLSGGMPVWRDACLQGCLSGGMPMQGDASPEGFLSGGIPRRRRRDKGIDVFRLLGAISRNSGYICVFSWFCWFTALRYTVPARTRVSIIVNKLFLPKLWGPTFCERSRFTFSVLRIFPAMCKTDV